MPLSSGASGLATVGNHLEQQKGNKKAPNRQTSGKSLRSNRSSKKNMDPAKKKKRRRRRQSSRNSSRRSGRNSSRRSGRNSSRRSGRNSSRRSKRSSNRSSRRSKSKKGPTIVTEKYGAKGNTPKSKTVQVNSKCGSMDNINHKAGGGKTKIFNQPVHYK